MHVHVRHDAVGAVPADVVLRGELEHEWLRSGLRLDALSAAVLVGVIAMVGLPPWAACAAAFARSQMEHRQWYSDAHPSRQT